MRVILKEGLLIVVPETEAEGNDLATWKGGRVGHVLFVSDNPGRGLSLVDLGAKEHACNEAINVISSNPDPSVRLISNFAPTPFRLDGRDYACVEAFWQGLKFEEGPERERVARLGGHAAREARLERAYGATVVYEGCHIPVGTWDHWELMENACWAKFTQNENAREALLATASRPLIHRTRRDSRDIPGAIMADIWMRIRKRLQKQSQVEEDAE
jgi:predicted NAD-dependent protein-ADP-ribosyltransferase YbiA (DUF1768 family)